MTYGGGWECRGLFAGAAGGCVCAEAPALTMATDEEGPVHAGPPCPPALPEEVPLDVDWDAGTAGGAVDSSVTGESDAADIWELDGLEEGSVGDVG